MRHAIEGMRPGTTYQVGSTFVATNPQDGGAKFTEAQIKELENRGYTLNRVSDTAPKSKEDLENEEAQRRINANRAAAEENNVAVNRAPKVSQK